jgi:hypothetical protein
MEGAWLGANPGSLLTDNFGISKDLVDRLPRKSPGISRRRG